MVYSSVNSHFLNVYLYEGHSLHQNGNTYFTTCKLCPAKIHFQKMHLWSVQRFLDVLSKLFLNYRSLKPVGSLLRLASYLVFFQPWAIQFAFPSPKGFGLGAELARWRSNGRVGRGSGRHLRCLSFQIHPCPSFPQALSQVSQTCQVRALPHCASFAAWWDAFLCASLAKNLNVQMFEFHHILTKIAPHHLQVNYWYDFMILSFRLYLYDLYDLIR